MHINPDLKAPVVRSHCGPIWILIPKETGFEAGEIEATQKIDHLLPLLHGGRGLLCTLNVLHTWVLTLLLLLHQILTELTISFLFPHSFLFSPYCSSPRHSSFPSAHLPISPSPPCFSSSSLSLFHPVSSSFHATILFHLNCLFIFSLLHLHHCLFPFPFPLLLPPAPPSRYSCDRLPVSSSLQRGKAVSRSPLQWPIESCWAPTSLLIGWAGPSRYWEEGLALLASCLSAYLFVCLHGPFRLCSRADLKSVSSITPSQGTIVIEILN